MIQLLLKTTIAQDSDNQTYTLLTKTVDEATCNPLKIWHDLGEPQSLSQEQCKLLREAAKPLIQTTTLGNKPNFTITVENNGVVYFELKPVTRKGDRGYSYQRAVGDYGI